MKLLPARSSNSSLVRLARVWGMVPDILLFGRIRVRSRRRVPNSLGRGPTRLVFLSAKLERKERLPSCGVMLPWSGTWLNSRPVTRCPWRLHETPTHKQKDSVAVQLLARMPRGSLSCALKASSAAKSVVLDGGASAVAHGISKMKSAIRMQEIAMVDWWWRLERRCLCCCAVQCTGLVLLSAVLDVQFARLSRCLLGTEMVLSPTCCGS